MAKNRAAVELGKLRAKQLTPEHQAAAAQARAKQLSAKRRKEIAKAAAAARWKKK